MLSYEYDTLGRRKAVWQNGVGTGTKRAEWAYDTITGAVGQLASTTRWNTGNAYVTTVTGYDNVYRPLGNSVSFPTVEGTLSTAGPWTTTTTYKVDGSVATQTLPAGGGLAAETITTSYDNNGFTTSSTGLDAYLASISYYPWGPTYQTMSGTAGKQIRLTTNLDEATGRLTSSVVETQNQSVPTTWDEKRTDAYAYDNAGNVTAITQKLGGAVVDNQCFAYDQLHRLTDAWTNTTGTCATPTTPASGAGPLPDRAGPTTRSATATSKPATASAAPATPSPPTPTPPPAAPTPHPDRHRNPNRTRRRHRHLRLRPDRQHHHPHASGTTQDLTWDPEGHLATHTINGQTTSYLYDAGGSRLLRRDPDGTTTAYLAGFEIKKDNAGVLSAPATTPPTGRPRQPHRRRA